MGILTQRIIHAAVVAAFFSEAANAWAISSRPGDSCDLGVVLRGVEDHLRASDNSEIQLLRVKALSWLNRQAQTVEESLATSGYGSLDEIRSALLSKGKRGVRAIEALEDPTKIQFVMHRPEEARSSIVENGFENFHQSGLTKGNSTTELDGSLTSLRNRIEAFYANIPRESYDAMDGRLKPLYGYVRSSPESGSKIMGAHGYGDDLFVFKKDRIDNYLTVYPGDSLELWRNAKGTKGTMTADPEHIFWDQNFIPWKDRMLIAPYVDLEHVDKFHGLSETLQVNTTPTIPMKRFFPGHRSERYGHLDNITDYLEFQVWKPGINLDDVEAFEFSDFPPRGKFLEELKKRKIKIFDRRRPFKRYRRIKKDGFWHYPDGKPDGKVPDPVWPPKVWDGTYGYGLLDDIALSKEENGATEIPRITAWGPRPGLSLTVEKSTGRHWGQDRAGVEWLLEENSDIPQTASAVVTSGIYRELGYPAPARVIVDVPKRTLASWFPGHGPNPEEELERAHIEPSDYRQLPIFATLVDDQKLLHSPMASPFSSNEIPSTPHALLSGDASSGAADAKLILDPVDFKHLPVDHPWRNWNRADIESAIEKLRNLSDERIQAIAADAHYASDLESKQMISSLKRRRDALIEGLRSFLSK